MRSWFRRSSRTKQPYNHGPRKYRPVVEGLEDRFLLAAPVINDLAFTANIPINKTLILPVTATDSQGGAITYTLTSSNSRVAVTPLTGTFLKISVANFGDMEFELFGALTPDTTKLISGLVKAGFYDGLTFHRVIPSFVIQGGDPAGTGSGTAPFTFDDEFNPNLIYSGSGQLALANSGKDTNGTQFFVSIGPQRDLDFNNAIFGQLMRGLDVLNKISQVQTT